MFLTHLSVEKVLPRGRTSPKIPEASKVEMEVKALATKSDGLNSIRRTHTLKAEQAPSNCPLTTCVHIHTSTHNRHKRIGLVVTVGKWGRADDIIH